MSQLKKVTAGIVTAIASTAAIFGADEVAQVVAEVGAENIAVTVNTIIAIITAVAALRKPKPPEQDKH